MRLQALILRAPHHRTEKDGFEFPAVVGEMTMRLAEDRNELRHLETEPAVLVGERGAMTLRLMFLPFRRVRPNLDALPPSGAPSPARRTVPLIQKPPLPIRSTMAAPLR